MPRKARGSGSSPEKQQTATTRRNTRRGQKVSEPAESEAVDEIPAHLLRGSDESSEQSDNDSDYGSPKKGKGRATTARGRGRKPKETQQEEKPAPTPSRPRRGRRGAAAATLEEQEQNSQEEYVESVNSQTTVEEHETSTMESTSDQQQPIASDEKEQEYEQEQQQQQPEPSPKKEDSPPPSPQEIIQEVVAEEKKVSEVTVEQDDSNNDQATANEEHEESVDDDENRNTGDHREQRSESVESNHHQKVAVDEKESSSSPEVVAEDEVSKDAPDISMEVDHQSDSRSNSPAPIVYEKPIAQRSRSSSGEIHEDSKEEPVIEDSSPPKKAQESPKKAGRLSPIKLTAATVAEIEKPAPVATTQRKRKWGARKADEPVIAITTDSLANIIAEEVKPVPLSDVKLSSMSPSPEPEEKRPRVRLSSEDRDAKKRLLKERLRKQEEEDERRNEQLAKHAERSQVSPTTIVVTNGAGKDRKVSLVSSEEVATAKPPSPPKNQSSKILCITNLVRPLTYMAVKSLVARTGELDDFWVDSIKSKCFVKYKTEDEAIETRHALHGVKWPEHNLKTLNVEFSTDEDMNRVIKTTAGERIKHPSEEKPEEDTKLQEKSFGWSKNDVSSDDRSRTSRRVREWDVGKKEADAEHDESRDRHRRRSADRENRREKKDRKPADESAEKRPNFNDSPGREEKDAPAQTGRLLDDLFRKSKTVPCIYWLPLSEEQIKEKEEQRQKNLAEHKSRMEEIIKNRELQQRERERERDKRREERKERERKRSKSRSRSRRRYSRERRSNSRDRRRYDRR